MRVTSACLYWQAKGTRPVGGALYIEAPIAALVSSALFESNAVLVRTSPSLPVFATRHALTLCLRRSRVFVGMEAPCM
jgi:hypothetical protein